jgi:protein gp37
MSKDVRTERTKIAWTDFTFNPWIGCTKVSAGCANCYAEREDKQRKWTPQGWGKGQPRKRTSAANWLKPNRWEKQAEEQGVRFKVFCASLADFFDEEVVDLWRFEVIEKIKSTPNLDWLLLTKRIEKAARFFRRWGPIPDNVWLGVTAENQETADARIPVLLDIPAKVRWVSYEPAIGPVDFFQVGLRTFRRDPEPVAPHLLDWIIVGGESGTAAREFKDEWARDTIRQCRATGVACFVKQLGAFSTYFGRDIGGIGDLEYRRTLKHRAGADPSEWPEDLRVREFPKR